MHLFIDTQFWVYSQKEPTGSDFSTLEAHTAAVRRFEVSQALIEDAITNHVIFLTCHQVGEIFHALAFRGRKLSRAYAREFCFKLLSAEFTQVRVNTPDHLAVALQYSRDSGVHVWDFLCLLPLLPEVDVIYSCDAHFKHALIQSFGPPIRNPLEFWAPL